MDHQSSYVEAVAEWYARRVARLTAEDGWLNLVGLWWLDDGPVKVGSAPDNDAVLANGPAAMGVASAGPDGFVFQPSETDAAAVRFQLSKAAPTRFVIGDYLLEAALLTGRPAFRIRERSAAARRNFAGIDRFPVDRRWRIVADWVPLEQPIHTSVDTIVGTPSDVTISHKARFMHDGGTYELLATHGTPQAPHFVLRDGTSGKTTYPASRFLFGEHVTETTVVLDFNKAINPPCAFTDFAACPLPPPENVLPFAIEAGEKRWKG